MCNKMYSYKQLMAAPKNQQQPRMTMTMKRELNI